MILLVNCFICEQPVPVDRAVIVETAHDGSEGYFAHHICYDNQIEEAGY